MKDNIPYNYIECRSFKINFGDMGNRFTIKKIKDKNNNGLIYKRQKWRGCVLYTSFHLIKRKLKANKRNKFGQKEKKIK